LADINNSDDIKGSLFHWFDLIIIGKLQN